MKKRILRQTTVQKAKHSSNLSQESNKYIPITNEIECNYIIEMGGMLSTFLGVMMEEDQKNGIVVEKTSSTRQEYFSKIFSVPKCDIGAQHES